jgi:hypothetical protein
MGFVGWRLSVKETWPAMPLPYTDTGPKIAFFVTGGAVVLLEQRTRISEPAEPTNENV